MGDIGGEDGGEEVFWRVVGEESVGAEGFGEGGVEGAEDGGCGGGADGGSIAGLEGGEWL